MPDQVRTLNITKRFDLSSLGEEWQDCYVIYRPMTVNELVELKNIKTDDISEEESVAFLTENVTKHFVRGKVSVLSGAGQQVTDMVPADVEVLDPGTLTALFAAMSGASMDPKGSLPAALGETLPSADTELTETPSSMDSDASTPSTSTS